MIASSIVLPSFTPAATRATRTAPIERRGDEQEGEREKERVGSNTRSQFAMLLALLGSAGPTVRADVLKTLPPDSASLIDRLLDGVGDATGEPAADSSTGRAAQLAGAMWGNGLAANGLTLTSQNATTNATDAMRYALMQDASRGRASLFGEDGIRSDNLTGANLIGSTGAGSVGNKSSTESTARTAALRALSRLTGKGGVSREQLLALGDEQGANMQAALDALLSHAGTAEGAMLANSANSAAIAAASAAALSAANAASAADVTTPVKDPNALAPELRTRLDRVVARMRDEYGSDVSIVETARSQERQDFLYAQGRTRQGPVVTWTQDSAHTRGEAVDVLVDGSWNNAIGFARLQRIAREEGLRTLGVKDPGHLELLSNGGQTNGSANVSSLIERRAQSASAGAASMASTALAGVAGVASVASVASVANRTGSAEQAAPSLNVTSAYSAAGAQASRSGSGTSTNTNDSAGREENSGSNSGTKSRATRAASSDASAAERSFGAMNNALNGTTNAHSFSVAAPASAATSGIGAAERVADVQKLQDGAGPASLSRMTLDIDGPNGTERITVDLRGNVVGTHITTDTDNAARLRAHTGELQDALGRQGLTADSVRISSSARLDPNAARAVASEREGLAMTQGATANGGAEQQASGQGSMRDRAMAREWEKNDNARKARDEQQRSAGQRGQRGTYNEDAR